MKSVLLALLVMIVALQGAPALPKKNNDVPQAEVTIEIEPSVKLSSHWAFVVDNSHSMRGIFHRTRRAFLEATSFSTDEFEFCVVAFNNQSMEQFRDWVWADESELQSAGEWIAEKEQHGVLSYGVRAIQMAIEQERDELTVLLITDGGFTEVSRNNNNFDVVTRAVEESQARRFQKGYGPAIICSLGVSNPDYILGNKPSDAACQEFLRQLAVSTGGGYWLVRDRR